MSEPALHIAFGDSAGGVLKVAGFGRKGNRLLPYPDDLSFGPIDPPDPAARIAWIERELGPTSVDNKRWLSTMETFWATALSSAMRRVVWFSRRSAFEYAGFLECLWRFGDTPFEVVDLTDLAPPQEPPHLGLRVLNPDYVRTTGLVARAAALPPPLRAEYRECWRQLRAENTPLRVVKDLQLASAPFTVYDDVLLAGAGPMWLKSALVVGRALRTVDANEYVRSARLRRLVEAGKLEAQGDLTLLRASEVRLPLAREAGEGGAGEASAG